MEDFTGKMTEEEKKDCLASARKVMHGFGDIEFVNPDDTFDFQCQRCGQCCFNRDDIIINSYDVYNGAKALGITCEEFVKQYCIVSTGGFSKLPMVTLGHKENGMCHFLDIDYMDSGLFKCTINDSKPGACSNHPLGLVTRFNDNAAAGVAFVKVDQCEKSKKPVTQTVKDWMKRYYDNQAEILAAHDFIGMYQRHYNFRKWYFIASLALKCAENNGADPSQDPCVKAFGNSCNAIMDFTYYSYDTSRPFLEQCEENKRMCDEFLTANDVICEKVEQAFNDSIFGPEMSVEKMLNVNDKGIDGNAKEPMMDLVEYAYHIAQRIFFKDNDNGSEVNE